MIFSSRVAASSPREPIVVSPRPPRWIEALRFPKDVSVNVFSAKPELPTLDLNGTAVNVEMSTELSKETISGQFMLRDAADAEAEAKPLSTHFKASLTLPPSLAGVGVALSRFFNAEGGAA